jgi:hypothetical protein
MSILVTHPRSGSTKILKCISTHLGIKNLGEFFYLRNSFNYGEIRFYHPYVKRSYLSYRLRNNSLEQYLLTVNSNQELQQFLLEECQNRIDHLDSLNSKFIFKYFFDNKVSPLFYKTVEQKVLSNSGYDKIYLYRKNILDAILSLIIKDIFINRPSSKLSDSKFNAVGHNYGFMETLYPKDRITISEKNFKSYSTMFVNFFLHLKNIKNPYSLCYENIFSQEFFYLKNKKISLNLDPELPMLYGVDKKDFFNNYEVMIAMLDRIVKDNNLEDLFKDLGIVYG